jgi:hypothetical protein
VIVADTRSVLIICGWLQVQGRLLVGAAGPG